MAFASSVIISVSTVNEEANGLDCRAFSLSILTFLARLSDIEIAAINFRFDGNSCRSTSCRRALVLLRVLFAND